MPAVGRKVGRLIPFAPRSILLLSEGMRLKPSCTHTCCYLRKGGENIFGRAQSACSLPEWGFEGYEEKSGE